MRLTRAIDQFALKLVEQGAAEGTRKAYARSLEGLSKQLGPDALVAEVTRADCREFLGRFASSGPHWRAAQTSILNSFFRFCLEEDWIDRSPMEKIARPRLPRPEDMDVVTVSSDGNRTNIYFDGVPAGSRGFGLTGQNCSGELVVGTTTRRKCSAAHPW